MAQTARSSHGISHPLKRAFLAAYSRYPNISKSAKRVKVDRRTHYDWLENDPDYRDAFEQAKVEGAEALEDAMVDFAFDGNVTAGIFLLKGLNRKKFGDKWQGELTGKDGKPLMDLATARGLLRDFSEDETNP